MKYKSVFTVLFTVSYILAIVLGLMGKIVMAMAVGGPALFLSGWAFIGHFITIDDEIPGEWSNPEGSKRIWYMSLGELSIKAVIFFLLLIVVYL